MISPSVLLVIVACLVAQTLTWPREFSAKPAESNDWREHAVTADTLRLRLMLPASWKPAAISLSEDQAFIANDLVRGLQIAVDTPNPTSLSFDSPHPDQTVKDTIGMMRDALQPRGYDVITGGQVRAGKRIWLWHEARMKDVGLFARLGPYSGGTTWIFTTTSHGRQITLRCTVLFPRDVTPADREEKIRVAGSVFSTMLERLTVDAK